MNIEAGGVTFSVAMTVKQFLDMDRHDYAVVMAWFPADLGVIELNWSGHFGPQLIVTCKITAFDQAQPLAEQVLNILKNKLSRRAP